MIDVIFGLAGWFGSSVLLGLYIAWIMGWLTDADHTSCHNVAGCASRADEVADVA